MLPCFLFLCGSEGERAPPPLLTLCAQCRHKYAIYASVWPAWARVGGTCVCVRMLCVRARAYICIYVRICVCMYVRESGTMLLEENVPHTRNVARARTCVLYGETWPYVFSRRVFGCPTIRAFPPVDSFRVSNSPDSSFVFPPSLPPPPGRTLSFLSLRHNCCNLRSRVVDLTVDLCHGNL